MKKSPFLVIDDFISPYLCEEIVDEVCFNDPDIDPDNNTVSMQLSNDDKFEKIIFERLMQYIPQLEKHYDFKYKGTERVSFERLQTGAQISPQCESCEYISNHWVKTKLRDFCCVVFLSDYNNTPPFDDDFECYGGKLEFINHQFGFNPVRGTMIVYPSDPRFTNASTKIFAGAMHQIRIHIAATTPFIYDPKQFQGNYSVWF